MRKTYEAYVGIANIYGLESFIPAGNITNHDLRFMELRVRFNSHRDGLVYRVFLEPEVAKTIQYLFDKVDSKKALVYMKKNASIVEAAGAIGGTAQEVWDRIPHFSSEEIEEMNVDKEKDPNIKQLKLDLEDTNDCNSGKESSSKEG